MGSYDDFLISKMHEGANSGFTPTFMPSCLMDFQEAMTVWSIEKGRAALFEDCGLGKTLQGLVWAQNVAQHTNKPVLILTFLAVAPQFVIEGEKFDIPVYRSMDGSIKGDIVVTNYQKLERFNPDDFGGVACDESSILKNFDGSIKHQVTEFMRKVPYRLLLTATAAPNDYIELGTSSEALGYMGNMDMLNKFFKNDLNNSALRRHYGEAPAWRFKGHAELPFWRWVCSWARAMRKPSDLGFDDGKFILPPLSVREHLIESSFKPEGFLFEVPALDLRDQRQEQKATVKDRCVKVAELVNHEKPAVMWCHLDAEGDELERMVPGAVQISGKMRDEVKEERLLAFSSGEIKKLVIKPKIGAWGMNWQHCAHMTYFPSHSYEQFYQSVRRFWRFGQDSDVDVDVIHTEGQRKVIDNMNRKARQAEEMFANLVAEMNNAISIERINDHKTKMGVPSWL